MELAADLIVIHQQLCVDFLHRRISVFPRSDLIFRRHQRRRTEEHHPGRQCVGQHSTVEKDLPLSCLPSKGGEGVARLSPDNEQEELEQSYSIHDLLFSGTAGIRRMAIHLVADLEIRARRSC